jgi:hypothetical protein
MSSERVSPEARPFLSYLNAAMTSIFMSGVLWSTMGLTSPRYFGELVCSNSLKAKQLDNACGLLKEEMRKMDSITMKAAALAKCLRATP